MGFRSLKPHLRPIYAPWVCASLTVSILAVALPLSILEHGRSYRSISVVMGAGGVGVALGTLRVGVLTDRWGAARVAVGALGVIAAASCPLGTTNIVALLALAQLAIGRGVVGVMLSRQAVLTSVVATDVRGRAMALVGGSMRLSVLVGAVSGGVLYDLVGVVAKAFGPGAAAATLAAVMVAGLLWLAFVLGETAGYRWRERVSSSCRRPGCRVAVGLALGQSRGVRWRTWTRETPAAARFSTIPVSVRHAR